MDELIHQPLKEFKREELLSLLDKSDELIADIQKIRSEMDWDQILNDHETFDPKVSHFANQHMTVIQEKIREQLLELKALKSQLVEGKYLGESEEYHRMKRDDSFYQEAIKLFLPYILVCSICLRYQNKRAESRNIEDLIM